MAESSSEAKTTTKEPTTLTREPVQQTSPQSIESRVEESSKVTESTDEFVEAAPSELVGIGRKPEICNLLEINEAYEHFNMKEYSNTIDAYINKMISKDGKEDNKESYKEVFEHILEESKPPRDDIYSMINRMKEYVELQNRLIQIAEDKEAFEKKSIEDLTVEELKGIIDGNTSI